MYYSIRVGGGYDNQQQEMAAGIKDAVYPALLQ
jgi:hypothetical protein